MIVVSNTTPLSELAKVGKMDLLREIFGKVIIPQEVYNEVTTGNHPAAREVPFANWIEVRSINESQQVFNLKQTTGLDLGECAAIILAEELNAQQILIDELAGRRVAEQHNLDVIGTVGILLLAKDKGLISSVKEILDALIDQGKRIGQTLYNKALTIANE